MRADTRFAIQIIAIALLGALIGLGPAILWLTGVVYEAGKIDAAMVALAINRGIIAGPVGALYSVLFFLLIRGPKSDNLPVKPESERGTDNSGLEK
jgi:hypothetical protein